MKRNAILPYLLIMVFGIGLVFALSFIGVYEDRKQASGDGGKDLVAQTPEEIYNNSCITCHGANYEGASGPELIGLKERSSADEVKDVLKNGKKGDIGNMPGGLVPDESLDEMAEWLLNLGS